MKRYLAGTFVLLVCGSSWAQLSPRDFETPEYYRNFGLQWTFAANAYALGFTGAGVKIGVADTAVQLSHPEFDGRVYWPSPQPPFPNPEHPDFPTHGTHVTGIAAAARNDIGMMGVAYDASIASVVVVGESGYPENPRWAQDLVDAGVSVMNGSFLTKEDIPLGGPQVDYILYNYDEIVTRYQTIRALTDADVVVVLGTGNDYVVQPTSSDSPIVPAGLPLITPVNTAKGYPFTDPLAPTDAIYRLFDDSVDVADPNTWVSSQIPLAQATELDYSDLAGASIAVTAVEFDANNKLMPARFANRCGAAADWCVAAFGVGIYSSVPLDTYADDSGTSMATPFVSGSAAVLRQAFPYMTARQIIEVLLTTASATGSLSASDVGHGVINLGRAVLGPIQFGKPSLIAGNASIFAPIFAVDTKGYDSTWSNDIYGTGGMSKAGAGVLRLTGQNTYTGTTTVTGGSLQVDGSIANSSLTVGVAGTLSGTGTVGSTTMEGTIAPGNSVGTITVVGDYEQGPDSVYVVEVGADQTTDKIVVQGRAVIDPGAALDLVVEDAVYLGTLYEILTATGGITGSFGELETEYPLLTIQSRVQGNGLSFVADRNSVAMSAFAQSGNQIAVANAIDAQTSGDEPFDTVVLQTNSAVLPGMFQSLSGEIYATNQAVLLKDSSSVRQALQWRMQDSRLNSSLSRQRTGQVNSDTTAWVQVLSRWDNLSASADASSATASSSGLVMGVDHGLNPDSRLGLALAFTNTDTSVSSNLATSQGYHLAIYGTTQTESVRLSAGGTQSWYETDVSRQLPADFGSTRGSPNSNATQLFAEVGLPLTAGRTVWQPFVNLSQTWLRTGGFQETGGSAALSGQADTQRLGVSTLGMRLQMLLGEQDTPWQVTAMAGWQHSWGDLAPQSTLQFGSGQSFSVTSAPLAQNALALELGVGTNFDEAGRVSLTYGASFGSGDTSQTLQARLNWRF